MLTSHSHLVPKRLYMELYLHSLYSSLATRVSQLKIWHFWVIGIERNVCRCTFNVYSVIMQFAKLAAGEQLCRRWTQKTIALQNFYKSLLKNHTFWVVTLLWHSCDTVVANELYAFMTMCSEFTSLLRFWHCNLEFRFDIHGSVHRSLLSRNTNKMQLCNRIYYSKVYWRLNMFRAAHRSS